MTQHRKIENEEIDSLVIFGIGLKPRTRTDLRFHLRARHGNESGDNTGLAQHVAALQRGEITLEEIIADTKAANPRLAT